MHNTTANKSAKIGPVIPANLSTGGDAGMAGLVASATSKYGIVGEYLREVVIKLYNTKSLLYHYITTYYTYLPYYCYSLELCSTCTLPCYCPIWQRRDYLASSLYGVSSDTTTRKDG